MTTFILVLRRAFLKALSQMGKNVSNRGFQHDTSGNAKGGLKRVGRVKKELRLIPGDKISHGVKKGASWHQGDNT